jgi:hypothetical protein
LLIAIVKAEESEQVFEGKPFNQVFCYRMKVKERALKKSEYPVIWLEGKSEVAIDCK